MTRAAEWDPTLSEKGRVATLEASKEQLEAALIHATEFLDTLPFKGERAFENQALSWPRSGVFRDDGELVTGVPDEIKEATALVAGFILAGVPFSAAALAWVFLKIGHFVEEGADIRNNRVTWH